MVEMVEKVVGKVVARVVVGWVLVLVVAVTGCGPRPAPKPGEARVAAGVRVEGTDVGGLAAGELAVVLRDMAARSYVAPTDARFDDADGSVRPERPGRLLDQGATAGEALAASPGSGVPARYRELAPAITAAALSAARTAGACATAIIDDSPGRLENIRLTAALINNAAVAAGEEFSFNRRTGEPTGERGFKPAAVLVDGRREQELGGGMCQVSSTLYGAVLDAGLTVVERHAHSAPVNYAPAGRDATTYTDKDLRFLNSTRGTLIIRAFVDGRKLRVELAVLPRGGE